ncbi:MAG TPA: flagellar motor protein MotB [Bryobacteraceae bacterium]|nr:flagellar motor protein MotB [Bryobacteraceae bacterium]
MSAKAHPKIIVVRKVAAGHDEEHGGAWKVAYADFVTAMMALFIVLWLLSASEKVQKAVGGYFQDPTGKGRQTGTTTAGVGETLTLNQSELEKLKERIEQAMRQVPAFRDLENQIRITITAEGLRIDLLETKRGLFFETGIPTPTTAGRELLELLGRQLLTLPNKVAIEGHTDSTPYGRADYSNWELSADRANSARRILLESGMDESRISQVRGFADQRLLFKNEPKNPSNRRISIIVRNVGLDQQEEAAAQSKPEVQKTGTKPSPAAQPAASATKASNPGTSSGAPNSAPAAVVAAAPKK